MSQKRDYYEVLSVSKTASDADLKKAYRTLAKEYHPDRRPGDKEAEEKFKEAAEAYAILSDPEKRAHYDRFGHQGPAAAGFQGFSGMEDILSAFGDIFGGMGGFGGRRVARGDDMEIELEISFLDAAHGCKRELDIERHVGCEDCNGSGARAGTQPQRCKACGGRGQVGHQQGFFVISTTCRPCQGKGSVIVDKCSPCRGSGRVPRQASVTVAIPPGIDDGQKLRLTHQGDPPATPGGEPGDLYVSVRVAQDSRFVRDGDNLWVKAHLSFADAVFGCKVQIPTADGPETVDVPAGTQPMARRVLAGRGMPNVRGRGRGDLIVQMIVQVPTPGSLPSHARELLEQLAPHLALPAPSKDARSSKSSRKGDSDQEDGHADADPDASEGEKEPGLIDRIFGGKKKKHEKGTSHT
jgi:molecular chaperone DnaJ